MKLLFVCRANVGRSQVAEAFYNSLVPGNTAHSAGYGVGEKEGQPLHEFIIQIMEEEGFDLSNKTRTQLTEEMIKENDQVIAIFNKEEGPDWLSKYDEITYWNVDDPAHQPIEAHRTMIHEVKERVLKFVKENRL